MMLHVEYPNGVKQQLLVVDQDVFDRYRDLKFKWDTLMHDISDEDQQYVREHEYLGKLLKDRKLVTTRSAIYMAHLNGGTLDLSPNQGIHQIKTWLQENIA